MFINNPPERGAYTSCITDSYPFCSLDGGKNTESRDKKYGNQTKFQLKKKKRKKTIAWRSNWCTGGYCDGRRLSKFRKLVYTCVHYHTVPRDLYACMRWWKYVKWRAVVLHEIRHRRRQDPSGQPSRECFVCHSCNRYTCTRAYVEYTGYSNCGSG
jgi:hypothetical protein